MRASRVEDKRALSPQKIDLHHDTRDMQPFYTTLMENVYHRPIVVTLLFPSKFCRKLKKRQQSAKVASPSSPVETSLSIFSQHGDDSDNEKARKTQIVEDKMARYFIVKANDVVESREADCKVIVRDYKALLSELQTTHNNTRVEDYFQPSSMRWWVRYLQQILLIFDRPNGKLSVLVDKHKIEQRVKRKMEHHKWMEQQLAQGLITSSTLEQPSHHPASFSENTQEMMAAFEASVAAEPVAAEDPLEDSVEDLCQPVLDSTVIKQRAIANVNARAAVEVSEEGQVTSANEGDGWEELPATSPANATDNQGLEQDSTWQSTSHEIAPDYLSSGSVLEESQEVPRSRPGTGEKPTRLRSSVTRNNNNNKQHKKKSIDAPPSSSASSSLPQLVAPASEKDDAKRHKSPSKHTHARGSAAYLRSSHIAQVRTGRLLESAYGKRATQKLFPPEYAAEEERLRLSLIEHAKKSRNPASPNPSVRYSVAQGSSVTKLPSIVGPDGAWSASILPGEGSLSQSSPSMYGVHDGVSSSSMLLPGSVSEESSLNLSDIAAHVAWAVDHSGLQDGGGVGSPGSGSFIPITSSMISPSQRPMSPFEEATKDFRGPQRVAADIIRKARKSVSGSTKFQVRRISESERKLLASPFAKKLLIEPPDAAQLLATTRLSMSSSQSRTTSFSTGAEVIPAGSTDNNLQTRSRSPVLEPVHDIIPEETVEHAEGEEVRGSLDKHTDSATVDHSERDVHAAGGDSAEEQAEQRASSPPVHPDITSAADDVSGTEVSPKGKIVYLESDDSVLVPEILAAKFPPLDEQELSAVEQPAVHDIEQSTDEVQHSEEAQVPNEDDHNEPFAALQTATEAESIANEVDASTAVPDSELEAQAVITASEEEGGGAL